MKRILFLLLLTVSVYGQNPSRFAKIQVTGNTNSGTATKVNVQEANGEVNTQTINTGFNKNIGLGGSDIVGATTLLNQYSTVPSNWVAQTYTLGSVVFYGGKQWIAKIATVAGDVPSVSSKWEEMTFESLANKTITVDAIPTDGSNNAVSSNGVFDALATKAPISLAHNPVTLGTANGLSLSTQKLSLGLASSGVTGALSGTDWNNFNNKQDAITNPITGVGALNYLARFTGANTIGTGVLYDNGTDVGIGTTITPAKLSIKTSGLTNNNLLALGESSYNANDYGSIIESDAFSGTFLMYNYNAGVKSANPVLSWKRTNGNVGIGTTTDNGVDKLQVNGTISASPAVSPNQVVVKSQLDAVASSGTYTPTITGATNITINTPTVKGNYIKIGNIVSVQVNIEGTPTANQVVSFGCTVPFNRVGSGVFYMGGASVFDSGATSNIIGSIRMANGVSSAVSVTYRSGSATNPHSISLNFQYDITQ